MTVQERLYTAEDFWNMRLENKRAELVKGEIVEMPGSADIQTVIAFLIGIFIGNFVYQRGLGYVTGADGAYKLFSNPDTVRIPDVAFITKERLPQLTGKYISGAPDLAVEVVSPGNDATEIQEKLFEYFEAGTRMVWIVYPKLQSVSVYTAIDEVRIVKLDGTLDGGDVLPGFSLPVRDIFKNLSQGER